MEIYITCLLQILSFYSPFRRFEMKNFLHRPTIDTKSRFILKLTITKLDIDPTLTQVFEAKDVLQQDIVEVRAGKQDDLVDVDKKSFGEITLDDLKSFREILCVKVIVR